MISKALILLYDAEGRVLLQHRDADAPTRANQWGFFGGKIEQGETPEQAVTREALEELEYPLRNPQLLPRATRDDAGELAERHFFIESYDSTKRLVQREGDALRWCTLAEAHALSLTPEHYLVLDALQRTLRIR